MFAVDQFGALSTVNSSVTVLTQPLESAVAAALNQTSAIEDLADAGETTSALLLIQAASELLNVVLGEGSEEQAEEATEARSEYLGLTLSVAAEAGTSSAVESSTVAIASLSSVSPDTLSADEQETVLNFVQSLANTSAGLGTVSTTASTAMLGSVSNIISAGILSSSTDGSGGDDDDANGADDVAADDDASSSSASTISYAATIEATLDTLNAVITASLVPGEDPVTIASNNLGMTNALTSPYVLKHDDALVTATTASSNDGGVVPIFALPPDLLDATGVASDEGVAVLATNWALNPFASESAGAALQNGSTVTSLTIGKSSIANLTNPIVLTLPLPATALSDDGASPDRRRRRAQALPVEDGEVMHVLQCSNETNGTALLEATEMEVGRAEYCGYDLLAQIRGHRDGKLPSMNVTCDDGNTYALKCTNATGSVSFTCPRSYSTGDCAWWDESSQTWSGEGCEWWYDDIAGGYSVCNCSHLTSFAAQRRDQFTSQTTTFVATLEGSSELSVHDLEKSKAILITLGTGWLAVLLLWLWKKRADSLDAIEPVITAYRNRDLSRLIEKLRRTAQQQTSRPDDVERGGLSVAAAAAAATAGQPKQPFGRSSGMSRQRGLSRNVSLGRMSVREELEREEPEAIHERGLSRQMSLGRMSTAELHERRSRSTSMGGQSNDDDITFEVNLAHADVSDLSLKDKDMSRLSLAKKGSMSTMVNQSKTGASALDLAKSKAMNQSFRLVKHERTQDERREFEDEVGEQIIDQKNVVANFVQALLANHDVLALFTKEGRTPAECFNRFSSLLASLVTVLFICCLSAPGTYLCPEWQEEHGWQDDDAGGSEGRRRLFGQDIAGKWAGEGGAAFIAAPSMINASLQEWLKFAVTHLLTGIFIGLWAFPVKWCLGRYYRYADLLSCLNESRAEHLMERSALALASPANISDIQTALVAEDKLDCMVTIIRQMSQVFHDRTVSSHVQKAILLSDPKYSETLQEFELNELKHNAAKALAEGRKTIRADLKLAVEARKRMRDTIGKLRTAKAAEERGVMQAALATQRGVVGKAIVYFGLRRQRKKFWRVLKEEVIMATIPEKDQPKVYQHRKTLSGLDGKVYGVKVGPVLGHIVKRIKRRWYKKVRSEAPTPTPTHVLAPRHHARTLP